MVLCTGMTAAARGKQHSPKPSQGSTNKTKKVCEYYALCYGMTAAARGKQHSPEPGQGSTGRALTSNVIINHACVAVYKHENFGQGRHHKQN